MRRKITRGDESGLHVAAGSCRVTAEGASRLSLEIMCGKIEALNPGAQSMATLRFVVLDVVFTLQNVSDLFTYNS